MYVYSIVHCMYVCMYVYTHSVVCVCMCVYVYMYMCVAVRLRGWLARQQPTPCLPTYLLYYYCVCVLPTSLPTGVVCVLLYVCIV